MSKIKGIRINYPTEKEAVPPYYANFNTTLPTYSPKYGITPDEEAVIGSHKTNLENLLLQQTAARNAAQQATQAFDEELIAAEMDAKRIMKKIMDHQDFARSDGEAMGFLIESPQVNPDTAKPVVSAVTAMMDMIVIDWVKKGMKGVVIYGAVRETVRDLNLLSTSEDDHAGLAIPPNLVWERLDKDQRSPWEDTRKNLSLQPEIRYYKLRYIWKDDQEVGFESDIVKVVAEIY